MVTAAGSNHMMAAPVLSGIAESGHMKIAGFYGKTLDVAGMLKDLEKEFNGFSQIAHVEIEGYLFAMAVDSMTGIATQLAFYRREPHKFFPDLQKFISSLDAQAICSISVSGSLGAISLAVAYRRA